VGRYADPLLESWLEQHHRFDSLWAKVYAWDIDVT
jgi:hypothetical protein